MNRNELGQLLATWETETDRTLRVLRALPPEQYDFRPDPGGRSLGELAWHLAEGDGYLSRTVETGRFDPTTRLPELKRPRTVGELAPAFEQVHRLAVQRVAGLSDQQLNATIPFIGGKPTSVSEILWTYMLLTNVPPSGPALSHVPARRRDLTGNLRAEPGRVPCPSSRRRDCPRAGRHGLKPT